MVAITDSGTDNVSDPHLPGEALEDRLRSCPDERLARSYFALATELNGREPTCQPTVNNRLSPSICSGRLIGCFETIRLHDGEAGQLAKGDVQQRVVRIDRLDHLLHSVLS